MVYNRYIRFNLHRWKNQSIQTGLQLKQLTKENYNIMNKELEKLWDLLVNYELASESTLQLVTRLNGYTLETMENILYALTGYHSYDQFMENER